MSADARAAGPGGWESTGRGCSTPGGTRKGGLGVNDIPGESASTPETVSVPRPMFWSVNTPVAVSPTLTVTVGDTATGVFTLQNIGLGTLTVSGVEADSPGMSFTPSPPFRVPPGVEQPLPVLSQPPGPAARASADIRIAGDDPYTPLVDVPISIEALSLTVQTRALIVGDRAQIGRASCRERV